MSPFIISLLLLILSVMILITILTGLVFSFRSYRWPKTQWVILSTGKSCEFAGGGPSFTYTVTAKKKYAYAVNGKKFRNNSISAFEVYDTAGIIAKKVMARYPRGKVVDVYYAQNNPGNSCLEMGYHSHDNRGIIICCDSICCRI